MLFLPFLGLLLYCYACLLFLWFAFLCCFLPFFWCIVYPGFLCFFVTHFWILGFILSWNSWCLFRQLWGWLAVSHALCSEFSEAIMKVIIKTDIICFQTTQCSEMGNRRPSSNKIGCGVIACETLWPRPDWNITAKLFFFLQNSNHELICVMFWCGKQYIPHQYIQVTHMFSFCANSLLWLGQVPNKNVRR